MEGDSSVV